MNRVVELKVLKQFQLVVAPLIGWAEEDWVGLAEPMSSDRMKQRQCEVEAAEVVLNRRLDVWTVGCSSYPSKPGGKE